MGERLNRKILLVLFVIFLGVDIFKEPDYFGIVFGFSEVLFAGIYKTPISAVHHSRFATSTLI